MKRPTIQASINAFHSLSTSRREQLLYLFSGLLGFVIDFGTFYGLIQFFQVPIYVAQWVGASVGFVHNHVWQHYVVFDHTQPLTRTTVISLFISVISIVASGPIVAWLSGILGQFLLAKVLTVTIQMIVLFFIRKYLIFKTHSSS